MKDKLDKIFSKYIRLRDSNGGIGQCCTCGKKLHWKEAHCGHFISRRHLATRWDERNTAFQCPYCNTYNQGQQYFFSLFIEKKYGKGTVDEIIQKSKETVKITKGEYETLIEFYKRKVKELEKIN